MLTRWLCSALLLALGCTGKTAFSTTEQARFDGALQQMQTAQASGGGLIAVEDGAHRYRGAIGLADVDSGRTMSADTPYRTASMGKTFTGALILALHDEGRLSVEDPLSRYLPTFPNGEAITLRMLLTHTSGIANYTHIPAYQQAVAANRNPSEEELIAFAAATPPDFPPGTDWNYSNTGYIILGQIAEQLTGRSQPDEVQARFLGPLGMTHTHPFGSYPDDLAASYHLGNGNSLSPVEPISIFGYPADGGWCTSLDDMVIWARNFLAGRLHSAQTLALARHPEGGAFLDSIAQAFDLERGGYALGFIEAHDATLGTLYAGAGNADGVRTFVGYLPEHDIAFATFVDVGDGSVPLLETLEATRPILVALRAHVTAN